MQTFVLFNLFRALRRYVRARSDVTTGKKPPLILKEVAHGRNRPANPSVRRHPHYNKSIGFFTSRLPRGILCRLSASVVYPFHSIGRCVCVCVRVQRFTFHNVGRFSGRIGFPSVGQSTGLRTKWRSGRLRNFASQVFRAVAVMNERGRRDCSWVGHSHAFARQVIRSK